ncbi:hypothetical protein C8T65DRAFT_640983, partial [Cerioporus squamosus]
MEHVKAAMVARVLTEKLLPGLFLRRTKDVILHPEPGWYIGDRNRGTPASNSSFVRASAPR